MNAFALIELSNVLIFINEGSNPARIPTSLRFDFNKRVYVLYKKTHIASFRIILRYFILV
jgi:hypothetical protein